MKEATAFSESRKENGMNLTEGSKLLLKQTDGYVLSKEELDALYVDQETHTKKLFKDLKRLQVQRQRALSKTKSKGKTRRRVSNSTGRRTSRSKFYVNANPHSSAIGWRGETSTPKSNLTRGNSRSSLSKTPKGTHTTNTTGSRHYSATPNSEERYQNSDVRREKTDSLVSKHKNIQNVKSSSAQHAFQNSQQPDTKYDSKTMTMKEGKNAYVDEIAIMAIASDASYRESKIPGIEQSRTALRNSNKNNKPKNLRPLNASSDGYRPSSEAAHGAQYTKHAYMDDAHQLSTDILYGKPTKDQNSFSEHKNATGSVGDYSHPSVNDDEGSAGAGVFPPDPNSDTEHDPRVIDQQSRHINSALNATEDQFVPSIRSNETVSRPNSGGSNNRHNSRSKSRPSSRSGLRRPHTSSGSSSRHEDHVNTARKRGQATRYQQFTESDHAQQRLVPQTAENQVNMTELAMMLRAVQGSISQLSSKMEECTDAVRSLADARHQKVPHKDTTADSLTGEKIQDSINVLVHNVQECTKAVHLLEQNKPHQLEEDVAKLQRKGLSPKSTKKHMDILEEEAATVVIEKLAMIRKDMQIGMSNMQQQLSARIDSTFADWLVDKTASLESRQSEKPQT